MRFKDVLDLTPPTADASEAVALLVQLQPQLWRRLLKACLVCAATDITRVGIHGIMVELHAVPGSEQSRVVLAATDGHALLVLSLVVATWSGAEGHAWIPRSPSSSGDSGVDPVTFVKNPEQHLHVQQGQDRGVDWRAVCRSAGEGTAVSGVGLSSRLFAVPHLVLEALGARTRPPEPGLSLHLRFDGRLVPVQVEFQHPVDVEAHEVLPHAVVATCRLD